MTKQSSRKTASNPPPPASLTKPSFVGTIAEGFAFGTGSSIARNVVNNVMGDSPSSNNSSPETLCESYRKILDACFETNQRDCGDIFEKMIETCYQK